MVMEDRDWSRGMKLRHLRVFAEVARHKSLTAAAASLMVTQPALSKWLRELESQCESPRSGVPVGGGHVGAVGPEEHTHRVEAGVEAGGGGGKAHGRGD